MLLKNRLLLLIFLPLISFSQQQELEELKLAVDTLFFVDKKVGLEKSERGLELAYPTQDTFYITYFLDQAGELNRFAGNYTLAIEQLQQCLDYKKGWKDLKDLSLTHNNLGKTYAQKGMYESAIFHFLEALKLMQVDQNLIGQAFYLNNIGAVYDMQHNYFKALDYYQQSLSIKHQLGDSLGVAASSTNVGITLFNLEKYEDAIQYFQTAQKIFADKGETNRELRDMVNIGKCYLELEDLELSKSHLMKAYQRKNDIEEEILLTTLCSNLGGLYLSLGQTDSASYFQKESFKLASHSNSFEGLMNAAMLAADIQEREQNFEAAHESILVAMAYKDSLVNEANIMAVAEMESKYELALQEKRIQEKNFQLERERLENEKVSAQNKFYIALIIVVVFLLVLILFKYRQNRRINELLQDQNTIIQNKNEGLEQLKEELKAELKDKTEILDDVFSKNKSNELPPELLSLSKREMEVLSYLALGKSDQEISDILFVSKATTKTHLRRIYSKLLVKGRSQAVAVAHKHGILGEVEK